jgi:hypothetical protein
MEMKKVISLAVAFAMVVTSFAIAGTVAGQQPHDSDNSTQITVNAAYPKLWWIGFNHTGTFADLTQTQQTVGASYYIGFAYNYSLGYQLCDFVIRGWYDFGLANSNYPAVGDNVRNMAFEITCDAVTWGTTMNFPGTPEMGTIGPAVFTDLNDHSGPDDTFEVFIPIWFGNQTRAAEFGEAVSGPTFSQTKNVALDNTFTWDFSVTVRDAVQTTASQIAWAEFGIQRNVMVQVSGNPTANAPPGSSGTVMAPTSNIVYSANTPYFVNATLANNLLFNGVGPGNIPSMNLYVQNNHPDAINGVNTYIGGGPTRMAAPMVNLYVWGWNNTALPNDDIPLPAPIHGNVTAGPTASDYLGVAYTELEWTVDVPGGTAEGIYWTNIRISIDS